MRTQKPVFNRFRHHCTQGGSPHPQTLAPGLPLRRRGLWAGKTGSKKFELFEQLCCDCYNVLRRHAHLFVNLWAMMLPAGLEGVQVMRDVLPLSWVE